jgi:hypothetical protein
VEVLWDFEKNAAKKELRKLNGEVHYVVNNITLKNTVNTVDIKKKIKKSSLNVQLILSRYYCKLDGHTIRTDG